MDHVLLYGPPGWEDDAGQHYCQRAGRAFSADGGAAAADQGDLTAIITNMQDKQVLFIDEIHRLQPVLEELLYSALEDYKLDIIIGQGLRRARTRWR